MFEAELVWGDSAVGILVLIRQSCHYNVDALLIFWIHSEIFKKHFLTLWLFYSLFIFKV